MSANTLASAASLAFEGEAIRFKQELFAKQTLVAERNGSSDRSDLSYGPNVRPSQDAFEGRARLRHSVTPLAGRPGPS